jgi:hypothetical protein
MTKSFTKPVYGFDEVEEFKENFANGVYKDEAEASISYVRASRVR